MLSITDTGRRELLRVMHFRSRSRWDFLELGKRTQTGCLLITGAAAGSGQKCENGSGESAEDTGHGSGIRRFQEKKGISSDEGPPVRKVTWMEPRKPVGWERGCWGSTRPRRGRQRRQ